MRRKTQDWFFVIFPKSMGALAAIGLAILPSLVASILYHHYGDEIDAIFFQLLPTTWQLAGTVGDVAGRLLAPLLVFAAIFSAGFALGYAWPNARSRQSRSRNSRRRPGSAAKRSEASAPRRSRPQQKR